MAEISSTFPSQPSPPLNYRSWKRNSSSPALQVLLQGELGGYTSTPTSPLETRRHRPHARPLRPKSFLHPPPEPPKELPKEISTPSAEFFQRVTAKDLLGKYYYSSVPLISENESVTQSILTLSKSNISFIATKPQNKPIVSFTILDIVKFCMDECSKVPRFKNWADTDIDDGSVDSWTPPERESSEWVATACHKLEDVLTTIPLAEIFKHGTIHQQTLSPNSTLADIMISLIKGKRVAIVENGNFIAMITRDYLIDFLHKNKRHIGNSLKVHLSSSKFSFQSSVDNNKMKKILQMFQILWEKQLSGALASSKLSSPLDLFLNWLGYAQKVAEDGDPEEEEPEVIEEEENLKTVLEFFSRRKNVRTLYVRDKSKNIRGRMTRKDLIRFLLYQ